MSYNYYGCVHISNFILCCLVMVMKFILFFFFLWKKEYNSSFSCRTMKLWEQSYSKNKQRTSVKSLVAQLAPLGLSNGEVQGSSPPSSIVSIGLSKTQITNHRSNTQQSSVQNRLLDPFQSEKPIPNVRSNGPAPTHTQTWFCQYASSC